MSPTFTFALCIISLVASGKEFESDSTGPVKKRNSKSTLTIRAHTLGSFGFTGRIISTNPSMDLFYTYERKTWGFSVFKAFDIQDHTTPTNFTLALIRKTFRLSKQLTIIPQVGALLEQQNSLADRSSDVASLIVTSFQASKELTIEYTIVVANLAFDTEYRDWINRMRFLYSKRHWDVSVLLWHNNEWIDYDQTQYLSTGLNVYYSRIRISDHFSLSAGVSGIIMAHTNEPEIYPKKNGVFFTLAGYIH